MTTLCGCEQLIGSLPEVKWAQQVRLLASQLQDQSLQLIVQHLPSVIQTQAFHQLLRVRAAAAGRTPNLPVTQRRGRGFSV